MKNSLINADTIKKGDATMYNQKTNSYGGQVRSYTSKVSEEGGRRPDEGLKETVRCNSDEMLKQVQHDGKGLAKDAQSQCPPLETLPNINNPVDCLYERKGGRRPDEGADKSALRKKIPSPLAGEGRIC